MKLVFCLLGALVISCSSIAMISENKCSVTTLSDNVLRQINIPQKLTKGLKYDKNRQIYFGEIKTQGGEFCFYDEFVIEQNQLVKSGRAWGRQPNCKNHCDESFLTFAEFIATTDQKNMAAIYDFWSQLKQQKLKFLKDNISWFDRWFNADFEAFFSTVSEKEARLEVDSLILYSIDSRDVILLPMFYGDSVWHLYLEIETHPKILSINRIII